MDNNFEKQFDRFEPAPELKVCVVAVLEDVGANRYFIKTEAGEFLYLDQGLEHCEKVDEGVVMSAIMKHGYKPVAGGAEFAFGERAVVLKPASQ